MAFADPFELNYSKVRAYLSCPHLYKFIYLDRKYPPHTPYSSLGISVHRALAKYHSAAGSGRRGLEELILRYDEGWHHQGFATPSEMLEFYRDGRRILENYWKAANGGEAETVYTEIDFDFPFERWRVRGTIDRVDRLSGSSGHEVIDYKMGFEAKTLEDLEKDLQLAMYAIGVKRNFGLEVKSLSWVLLVQGTKVTVPWDPAREESTLALLRDTGEKILALDLSRKGNCATCSIRALCPDRAAV